MYKTVKLTKYEYILDRYPNYPGFERNWEQRSFRPFLLSKSWTAPDSFLGKWWRLSMNEHSDWVSIRLSMLKNQRGDSRISRNGHPFWEPQSAHWILYYSKQTIALSFQSLTGDGAVWHRPSAFAQRNSIEENQTLEKDNHSNQRDFESKHSKTNPGRISE